jgi:hypothetical protein
MKKFEDIPKKDHLGAPDGYFDSLPGRISARIEQAPSVRATPVFRYALQLAVAFVIIAAVGITWFISTDAPNAENLLASIETEELINYLAEADNLSSDEFLEEMNLSDEEASALEGAVFDLQWQDESSDALLDELENYNL